MEFLAPIFAPHVFTKGANRKSKCVKFYERLYRCFHWDE